MAKRLYDVLKDCNKEEEVKSEFCKFFKMKINALKSIWTTATMNGNTNAA